MHTPASLRRRLASALYETLTLAVIVICAGLLSAAALTVPTRQLSPEASHLIWQTLGWLLIVFVPGLYLTWCWRRGQTLAMRAWGIRIESTSGHAVSLGQAWQRYFLAWLLLLPLGLGWWFALLRRDRQFLHDHLAGTQLIQAGKISAAPATTPSPAPPG